VPLPTPLETSLLSSHAGTKRKEVEVEIGPRRLAVKLGWWGGVVDGELQRRCKAGEALWTLSGAELQVRLPCVWESSESDSGDRGPKFVGKQPAIVTVFCVACRECVCTVCYKHAVDFEAVC
jgi:hypothetical protein